MIKLSKKEISQQNLSGEEYEVDVDVKKKYIILIFHQTL